MIQMDKPNSNFLFELKNYQEAHNIELKEFYISDGPCSLALKYSLNDNIFNVGKNATFGAVRITCMNNSIGLNGLLDDLISFIGDVSDEYELKLPPSYLGPVTHSVFEDYFTRNSAEIINEKNQYIDLSASLEERSFSATNRKIVRRLKKDGYEVRFEDSVSKEGYDLLARNRARRNVELSLSFNDLKKQSEMLPEYYLFASCFNAERELIAYSICVKLREDLLYVLYWGEEFEKRVKSPVVLLCHELVEYSLRNGLRYLDVGISSVEGEVDLNLFGFKQRLGCMSCEKLIVRGSI